MCYYLDHFTCYRLILSHTFTVFNLNPSRTIFIRSLENKNNAESVEYNNFTVYDLTNINRTNNIETYDEYYR